MTSLGGGGWNRLRRFAAKAVTYGYTNYLRSFVPHACRLSYNGVLVNRTRKPLDFLIRHDGGWDHYTHNHSYESEINRRLRHHVRLGDDVVVVGGGLGTSTVVAARQAGDDGFVTTYEGAREMVENVLEAAELNGVDDVVEVNHAVVSQAISLRGDSGGADTVQPHELPDCDVLELDCEGAEIEVLEEMSIRPHTVIVETHGMHDTPPEEVKAALRRLEYDVRSQEVAENWSPAEQFCVENGIDVVTAVDRDVH